MVEPDALLEVKLGSCLRAAGDIESLHQLVEREDFLLCARIPAQQCKEIDYCLWEITALTITRRNFAGLRIVPLQWEYRETETVAITLAQLTLTLWLEKQWKMGKARHGILPAESLVEKYMQWCTWQPLLAADHMRDFHQMIVHDIGQVVSRKLVGTLVEHLVVEDIAHHLHIATNHIVDVDFLSRFYLETYGILLAVCDELVHLFLRKGERITHLHTGVGIILEILDFSTLGLQFLWSIKSDVSLAIVEKLLYIFLIDVTTLALTVRTMLTTEAHSLIKLDAEPLE